MVDRERTPTPQERARYIMTAEADDQEALIVDQITEAVRAVLERIGVSGVCATCGKAICWISLPNGGRRVPYSTRGVPHTIDCNMANRPGKLGRWGK